MTIVLRDYQLEALMAWFRNDRKGIIELPTGTGKTYIGMKVLEYYYNKGRNVMVVVPTEILLRQWREKILKYTIVKPHEVGLLYGREKSFKRVTISIVNTCVKYLDRVKSCFDLFILDEVHHYFAPVWSKLISEIYDNKDILGLSATVERSDRRHLNSPLKVIYRKSYVYMQSRGYVAPIKVYIRRVPLTSEEMLEYSELENAIRNVNNKLESAKHFGSEKEVRALEKKLMILVNKRKQLCSEAVNKLPVVLDIIKENEGSKIIVFTESIRTVVQLKEYLERHGVRCGVVHNKVKNRKMVLEMWRRGVFNVLLTVRVLDEGIDVPDCNVAIIVSNSLAKRQLIQRIGRTVRPRPGKTAKIYIVSASATFEERIARMIRRIIYEAYH